MGEHFKPDLICSFCGPIGQDYRIEHRGTASNGDPLHQVCFCNKCGEYIKHLAKADKYGTKEQQSEIWQKTNGRCCYCGTILNVFEKRGFTYEHIKAQVKGGSNETDNLMLACKSCNSSKGKKDVEEYREYLRRKHGYPKWVFYYEVLNYSNLGDILTVMF